MIQSHALPIYDVNNYSIEILTLLFIQYFLWVSFHYVNTVYINTHKSDRCTVFVNPKGMHSLLMIITTLRLF